MTFFFRKAGIFLKTYTAAMLEYRAELVLWALSGSLPFILMGVWMQAAAGGTFQQTPTDFARYFLAVFLVRQLTVVYVIWEFETEVVQGRLSPLLLQPMDPVWRHVAGHLAERVARFPVLVLLVAAFLILYPEGRWMPSALDLLRFLCVTTLAFCLRFLTQYTFALFAFWTEKASALEELNFLVYLFLSGLIAPLDTFPEALKAFVLWTPFPYLVYFPAQTLLGQTEDLWSGIGIMAGWMVVIGVANRTLWRIGLRRYSGMGA